MGMKGMKKINQKEEQNYELDIAERLSRLNQTKNMTRQTDPSILDNELVSLSDFYNTYKDLSYADPEKNIRHQKILDYILLRTSKIQGIKEFKPDPRSTTPDSSYRFYYGKLEDEVAKHEGAMRAYSESIIKTKDMKFDGIDNLSLTENFDWSREYPKRELEKMGFETSVDVNSSTQERNAFKEKITDSLIKLGFKSFDDLGDDPGKAKKLIEEHAKTKIERARTGNILDYIAARDELLKIDVTNRTLQSLLENKVEIKNESDGKKNPATFAIYDRYSDHQIVEDIKSPSTAHSVKNMGTFEINDKWRMPLSDIKTRLDVLLEKCKAFNDVHPGEISWVAHNNPQEGKEAIRRIDITFKDPSLIDKFMSEAGLKGKLDSFTVDEKLKAHQNASEKLLIGKLCSKLEVEAYRAIKEYERSKIIVPSDRKKDIAEIKGMLKNWDSISNNLNQLESFIGKLESNSKLRMKMETAIETFKQENSDDLNKASNYQNKDQTKLKK